MSDQNPTHTDALPERPHSKPNVWLIVGIAVVVIALIVAIVVYATGRNKKADAANVTVTIGVTDEAQSHWAILKKKAAAEGINVVTKNFSDYTQANPALSQKQLDLNEFQHLLYLANYNVSNNDNLTPIGATFIVPLPLYSQKHTSLDQIPRGGKIAIPNDPTNQARALLVLQAAKLITLKNGGSVFSTPADIDAANSTVSVTPVDAAQTVAALPSVDGAVINNNFAADAKLDPSKALYKDDPNNSSAEPYINVFVARAEDKDNATYKRVVELYHETDVVNAARADSKDTAVIVDRPASELQTILDGLEAKVKASKNK
ncbi:D-methionine transport system substrate-binding protein [Propionibacterium cyclohexanicum]|uniref:D-methionine transport system substrate-binding protein n=1 Tax=Propionibacterium cyclohexanicum TaxID=64702 RepID=A0A1H9RY07_9ACTN|nr:MetQ/NlpA family ABC transporter substrate-binding protein [Propionibacterium cyclohexanicum]SER77696.1 D-methionine transport system substrate-binding protein [Propionibacterium cyclohexanicum]